MRAFHAWRNRETLTVLMFHRVLPKEDMMKTKADPLYCVTPAQFASVIAFVRRYYTCVSMDDVLASYSGTRKLPPRAALITFDDGWRDNLDYAAPLLRNAGVQGVLFAATGALENPSRWWQETVLWALRSNTAAFDDLWRMSGPPGDPGPPASLVPEHALMLRFARLEPRQRDAILAPFTQQRNDSGNNGDMLPAADLPALKGAFSLGGHGASHLPLTHIPDAGDDVRRARDWLNRNAGSAASATMSFPHGRYDARVTAAARDAGYRIMFTSDSVLNPCPGGWLKTGLLGRIEVIAKAVTAGDDVVPERLASWLFLRPRQALRL
jgi:peptidoglycan/xylan/chitin deacetylase (PgdA/CDA1 family)